MEPGARSGVQGGRDTRSVYGLYLIKRDLLVMFKKIILYKMFISGKDRNFKPEPDSSGQWVLRTTERKSRKWRVSCCKWKLTLQSGRRDMLSLRPPLQNPPLLSQSPVTTCLLAFPPLDEKPPAKKGEDRPAGRVSGPAQCPEQQQWGHNEQQQWWWV